MTETVTAPVKPDDLLIAKLVYDGAGCVIPAECGTPRADQMAGSIGENVCELAGRICYDSLGKEKTRGTVDYHKHIQDVGHLSVMEHFNLTVTFVPDGPMTMPTAVVLLNRPGVFARYISPVQGWRVTLNARSCLEWDSWSAGRYENHMFTKDTAQFLGEAIRHRFHQSMPIAVSKPKEDPLVEVRVAAPQTDDERWISLYLAGSRGFSHEQVRHGDCSAISQRSTRFCDECDSPWVRHPVLDAYLADPNLDPAVRDHLIAGEGHVITEAQGLYREVAERLTSWLKVRGVDGTTARKQARGAARGYLGNALHTEMIFSASVAQWQRMLRQRANPAADAEIRRVYVKALPTLKASRYAGSFAKMSLTTLDGGVGEAMVEAK